MKRHLQCAEQQVSPSNLTKYCACHEKWLDCFIVLTYETSFPMRGATGVTIQPHQILRLPRKMTLQDFKENLQKQMKRHFQCGADPSMIRPWSDHENANRNPPRKWGYFSSSPRAFSIEKYNVSRPILHSNLHQILRLPRKVPLELHQILRLSRRKTHILSPHHIWNVIYSARSNRCHHPTSPNTAPATKNDSTALSSSHMKRHFQCAEQQVSPSNLTKYCACHEKWLDCFIVLTYETSFPMRGATGVTIQPHQILRLPRKMTLQDFKENLQKQVKRHFQCGADPCMIRAWSEHDPTMIREWKRKPQPASQPRLLFDLTTSIFYCKIQRFAPNLTFKPSPSTAPATKSDAWTSPSTAPATKSDTWTSPSTAPATKSATWTSPSTAPATKSNTWTSPSTAPATKSDTWTSPSTASATKSDTWTSPSTAPATKSDPWTSPSTAPATKSDTWTSPSTAPATKSDTRTSLLYSTWLYLTLLDSTWFYLTLVDSTLLDSTWLYSTLLDSTWLCLTRLDSTWLYLTLLDSTWL